MSRFSWVAIGTMTLCFGVTVLADEASTPPGKAYRSTVPPQERQAFFGDLHLHTVMSLDAWTFGTKITPVNQTLRDMVANRKELTATAFIADQSATPANAYWMEPNN